MTCRRDPRLQRMSKAPSNFSAGWRGWWCARWSENHAATPYPPDVVRVHAVRWDVVLGGQDAVEDSRRRRNDASY